MKEKSISFPILFSANDQCIHSCLFQNERIVNDFSCGFGFVLAEIETNWLTFYVIFG